MGVVTETEINCPAAGTEQIKISNEMVCFLIIFLSQNLDTLFELQFLIENSQQSSALSASSTVIYC